jgi:pimeloyl-ACP methyl ester carboxylesterase
LPDIDIPTLLIFGDRSQFYSLAVARYVHQRIPGSVLKVYPGADHSPQLSHPERLVRDLLSFTATIPSGAGS